MSRGHRPGKRLLKKPVQLMYAILLKDKTDSDIQVRSCFVNPNNIIVCIYSVIAGSIESEKIFLRCYRIVKVSMCQLEPDNSSLS